jgi:hypothetical protein
MSTQKSKRRSHLFTELHKRGITIVQERNGLISLSSGDDDQKTIFVRIVDSQSRIIKVYHSNNKSPVKAIGVFQIPISSYTQPDFYILTFSNKTDGKTEFVIIEHKELFRRLELFNHGYTSEDTFLLVLWLLQNNRLFDVTNIGIEGEWYFIAGGMAIGTNMDYTSSLNNWGLMINEKNIVSQPEENWT